MFEIDISNNAISALKRCSFSELNLKEIEHLQEWIAKNPNSLGEELLIIQKEFDGYDEENWPEIIRWIHANISALEMAIKPILKNYKQ